LSRSHTLFRLQTLDSELDGANKQLAEILVALCESETLKKAKKTLEVSQVDLHAAQAKMQASELEVKSLANKISEHEKLLYSGKVTSAKEAANLQEEVASLKRWHANREEHLLEAMVSTEEAEARLEQAKTELSSIQAQWESDQEDLNQKKVVLEARIAELTKQRPTIVSSIAGADLSIYESLRRKKAGRAVAAVKSGVCQGCSLAVSNNEIQQARAGTELVYCSTCGRILHVL
jgi:predicted  nucleic acid-binding Zn-ribbon protein